MTDREKHLDWLCRLKSNLKVFIPKDFHLDEFEQSLDYAISSINTDLKYDLIYEGEEVYTKADMVAMLTDIQLEIEELKNEPACCHHFVRGICRSSEVIQQKIDALKEKKDDTDNPTNGDMIKAMFPNWKIIEHELAFRIYPYGNDSAYFFFDKKWWNSPYMGDFRKG